VAFETGFAVTQEFPIYGWEVQDASGASAVAADAPQYAKRAELLEVDNTRNPALARLLVSPDRYVVGIPEDSLR
jgi:hypothetical protein